MATVIQKIDPNRHKMRIISHGMRVIRPSMPVIDRESIGAAFGRAPQGRGAPLWMLSLSITGMPGLITRIPRLIMYILCRFGSIFWITVAIPVFFLTRPILGAREI